MDVREAQVLKCSDGAYSITLPSSPDRYAITAQSGGSRISGSAPPAFVVHVPDLDWWDRLTSRRPSSVASAFVAGEFDVAGDLVAAMRWWSAGHWWSAQHQPIGRHWLFGLLAALRPESWFQSGRQARRNVRFHYDRSNAFYQLFLDRKMLYSCAYFADPCWTLDEAQDAKLDLICRKLDLQPDETFLDVGCGWGGLVIHAAERYGVSAVGCTLSAGQLAFAQQAARERNLAHRVVVEELDYRLVPGRFDKIASVGMYEHVGRRRLGDYFKLLAERLTPDGRVLNHGIARPQLISEGSESAFLRRNVFPGGELPHLSEVIRHAEAAGFEVLDVENLRPHYALTCAEWAARLASQRELCLREVDARTYRTWRLYLAGAAVSFEQGQTDIYQTLLARRTAHGRRRLSRAV